MRMLRYLRRLSVETIRSWLSPPARASADVYVDPTNRSRRFLLLAQLLSGIGFTLRVHWSLRQFFALNDQGYTAFSSPRVRLARGRGRGSLTVSDEKVRPRGSKSGKVLWVRYEARACPDPLPPRTTFVPLLFHPLLMTEESFKSAERFSHNTERSMVGFFAGNADPESYNNPVLGQEYGLLNRHEVVQVLREPEFADWLYEPASWEEFESERIAGRLRTRFTLMASRRVDIPQSRWLELLGQTKFFLAPPGYTQPFCHNLVEAMSVGAVPITGYGHLLRPKLVPEREMLEYSDAESLRRVLRRLRAGEFPDWGVQSRAARNYQQAYLSPQALDLILSRFIDEPGQGEWTLILSSALP